MRSLLRTRRARWMVPTAVTAALAVGVGGTVLLAGASSPALPDKTAAELLADVHEADDQPFSGTVVQTSRLGLPELPGLDDSHHEGTTLSSMLSGSNTARIWYSSPEQVRFALMGSFDEVNIIRDSSDVWMWTSSTNTVDHLQLPPGVGAGGPGRTPHAPVTPQEAAERVLESADPTTEITVDGTAEVAGRAAYELVAAPRDERSLVGDVRMAIDAETSMPLRFEVNARGSDEPAFEVGFTSVNFAEPGDDVFRFTPPPDATVNERSLADLMRMGEEKPDPHKAEQFGTPPEVVGEGWTSVAVLRDVELPSGAEDDSGMLEALLSQGTPVTGPYGSGLVFETTLLSALFVDDGTVLVGAVSPDVLEEAATEVTR